MTDVENDLIENITYFMFVTNEIRDKFGLQLAQG